MGDELRRLPGEHEVVGGLLAPAFHRFGRGRAVEHAVKLGGGKLRGVKAQLILLLQAAWKEWPLPGIIMPSGSADPDLGHGQVSWRIVSRASCLAILPASIACGFSGFFVSSSRS